MVRYIIQKRYFKRLNNISEKPCLSIIQRNNVFTRSHIIYLETSCSNLI